MRAIKERYRALGLSQDPNVHLVETLQDDNSRAISSFTFIKILSLPLSFVPGLFGMNAVGITGIISTIKHFWEIAAPTTVGIVKICAIVVRWGEDILVCDWRFASLCPIYDSHVK